MRRMLTLTVMLGLAACEGVPDEAADMGGSIAELTVGQLGSLASRILENPAAAEELLAERGLTVERLDSLVYEIATDAEATAEYVQALRNRDE